MKRSTDELDAEFPVRNDMKKSKPTKLCPPFCAHDCPYRGGHSELILSLVNLQDLEAWKTSINKAKESRDLNKPLEDPVFQGYTLLHWAAMLGKDKAVKWLLEQELFSLSNNNKTVLFSMVRYLHEGVDSPHKFEIVKVFVRILDVVVKHDPNVLLVKEGHCKDTVLHLCARQEGEEDSTSPSSTAPFFEYLKRMLGKLEEYSKKMGSRLPLSEILETRNEEGDAFLHLLARTGKPDKRKEARNIMNIAEDKFPTQYLGKMTNKDGKTAEEVWNESMSLPDPEVFQTSSQEIPHFMLLSKASCKDDEKPSKDLGHQKQETASHGSVGSGENQGYPGRSEEDVEVERLQTQSQGLLTTQCDEVQSEGGSENKGDKGIPSLLFLEPFPDKTSHQLTSLQSVVAGIKGQRVLQTKPDDCAQESDLHGAGISCPDPSVGTQPGSNTDTRSTAQDSVRKLIDERESELRQNKRELEEAKKNQDECEKRLNGLRSEVERLQVEVQAKENKLKNYKAAFEALRN